MQFKTDRLTVRRLIPGDAQAVHENSLDENTRRFVPDEVFETLEAARETVDYLIACYDAPGRNPLVYGIYLESSCIGYVQAVPLEDGTWEIGYHIAKPLTGRGYATEAVRAFLPVMTEQLGISEVYGVCLKENIASKHVLVKCGFEPVFEGIGDYQGEKREVFRSVWRRV